MEKSAFETSWINHEVNWLSALHILLLWLEPVKYILVHHLPFQESRQSRGGMSSQLSAEAHAPYSADLTYSPRDCLFFREWRVLYFFCKCQGKIVFLTVHFCRDYRRVSDNWCARELWLWLLPTRIPKQEDRRWEQWSLKSTFYIRFDHYQPILRR